MWERRIPFSERTNIVVDMPHADIFAAVLLNRLKDIQPASVKTVIDPYCGVGINTIASFIAFPNSTIHAIDYYDLLIPEMRSHPRVTFHKGLVTDILATSDVPKADVVIVSNATELHGFTAQNIDVLSSHVGGVLLTIGDNGILENEPWFLSRFAYSSGEPVGDITVWTPRN